MLPLPLWGVIICGVLVIGCTICLILGWQNPVATSPPPVEPSPPPVATKTPVDAYDPRADLCKLREDHDRLSALVTRHTRTWADTVSEHSASVSKELLHYHRAFQDTNDHSQRLLDSTRQALRSTVRSLYGWSGVYGKFRLDLPAPHGHQIFPFGETYPLTLVEGGPATLCLRGDARILSEPQYIGNQTVVFELVVGAVSFSCPIVTNTPEDFTHIPSGTRILPYTLEIVCETDGHHLFLFGSTCVAGATRRTHGTFPLPSTAAPWPCLVKAHASVVTNSYLTVTSAHVWGCGQAP